MIFLPRSLAGRLRRGPAQRSSHCFADDIGIFFKIGTQGFDNERHLKQLLLYFGDTMNEKPSLADHIFHHGNTFYLKSPSNTSDGSTLLLAPFHQPLHQPLQKLLHRLHQNPPQHLLHPDSLTLLSQPKLFQLHYRPRFIPLSLLTDHEFSVKELVQVAITGISSLDELHAMDIVHGNVCMHTVYMFNSRRGARGVMVTGCGLNVVDSCGYLGGKVECWDRGLCAPVGVGLGLGSGFKGDLESFLYVLVGLATGDLILSQNRVRTEWGSQEKLLRWKIDQYLQQIMKHLPEDLHFLIDLHLMIQQLDCDSKPDYAPFLKRLWKHKDDLIQKDLKHMIKRNTTIQEGLDGSPSEIGDQNSSQSLSEQKEEGQGSIVEEEIELKVRAPKGGFVRLINFE